MVGSYSNEDYYFWKTIDVLRKLLSSHGICEESVSDNGPQLVSHDFKSFCEANGVKHARVVPYHSQSNGAAERCVQTVKNSLKKNTKSHGMSHDHRFLRYRCTPHSVTGVTPCQLFFTRNLRNKFSLLKHSLEREMEEKQQKWSENVTLRELVYGDNVHVRNDLYGQVKWAPGTLVCRLGPLTYLIQVHGKRRYCSGSHLHTICVVNTLSHSYRLT